MEKKVDLFQISYYLVRYITGILTADQANVLRKWFDEVPARKRLLGQWESRELFEEKKAVYEKMDYEEPLQRFLLEKHRQDVRRRKVMVQKWSVAAAVVLLLGGSIWFGLPSIKTPTITRLSFESGDTILPGEVRAVLTLASGEQVVLDKEARQQVKDASGVTIDVAKGRIEYKGEKGKVVDEPLMNELYIPRGGEFYVVLGDGTRVWLNADTKLRYPVQFAGKERKVYLSGEAYFEVMRDEQHPFRVICDHNEVMVLGTSFDVRAYPGNDQQLVTLVEGRVKMQIKGTDQNVVLESGEQAVFDMENGELNKRRVDALQYCAWREGRLVFRQTRLEEILDNLARWYDVDIVWRDYRLKELEFTGEMLKYGDLDEVLDVIATGKDVHFKIDGRTVIAY